MSVHNSTGASPKQTRQGFLSELGLFYDPFTTPTAEKELREKKGPRGQAYFFSYVIDPVDPDSRKPLPLILQDAQNGFVFGPPGSGKTTLRYLLEAEYRFKAARRLVVTCDLREQTGVLTDLESHAARLSRELALDLFIQIIERLDTMLEPITAQQIQKLGELIAITNAPVARAMSRLLREDFSNAEYGLAQVWPGLGRPAVRYVDSSSKISNLLNALSANTEKIAPVRQLGENLLKAGLDAARAWQFEQIFVLVDNVDANHRNINQMIDLLRPLLDHLASWQNQNVFFYFFLPDGLEPTLQMKYRETLNKALTFPAAWWIINWDRDTLTALLHERLRAGGSRAPGFNALAAPEFHGKLEDYLIEASANIPRQLLRVVSALIEAHVQVTPNRSVFTPADWQMMRETWGYGPPPPPPPPFALNRSSLPEI